MSRFLFQVVLRSVALLLVLQAGTERVRAAESRSGPLLSGCEVGYPPFCVVHPDGRADGFSVELMRAALKAMDREVTFRTGPWAEVRGWLERGEVAALPLVGRTPEREEVFDFTVPYLTMHGAIVVRKDSKDINDLGDLRGRRVGVMQGDNTEEFLRREDRGLIIAAMPTFADAFRDLSAGRCDAVVIQRLVAVRLLAESGLTNLKILDRPVEGFSQDFCFAVREADRDTLALLNEGLALVVADGTHRRLHAKWFAELELPSARPIVVGGEHNFPPFEYLDEKGHPEGFAVEMTGAIARQTGLDIRIRLAPWSDTLQRLRNGEIDAVQGSFYTAERDGQLDFSAPYLVVNYVGVVRRGQSAPPGTLADLAGRNLVAQAGDVILDLLSKEGLRERTVTADSHEHVLRAVAEGRRDCALVARSSALHLIAQNGWTNLVLGTRSLFSGQYCYAVLPGRDALLAELNEGLQLLKDSGESRSIYDKWLSVHDSGQQTWHALFRILALTAGVSIGIALLALAWSWSLRRQVSQRTAELAGQNDLLLVFRTLVEQSPVAIFIQTRQRFAFVNAAALRLFGCGEAEHLLGKPVIERFQVADREAVHERIRRLNELHQAVPNREETCVRLDATLVEVEVSAVPFAYQGEHGALVFANDITARKQAESRLRQALAETEAARQALQSSREVLLSVVEDQREAETRLRDALEAMRASEERFRRAVLDAPFPIMLHAEDGEILQVSNAWCEITGYSRAKLGTVADWLERAYGPDLVRIKADIDARYGLEHRKSEGDYHIRISDGTIRIWEFSSAPLGRLPDGRRLVISMAMDVTDRREAEEEVRKLNEELEARVRDRTARLEEANKELEAFSYSVSHDLRAPLRHINGYVDLLRQQAEPVLNDKARRFLNTIEHSATEMGRLIDDLLAFSRVGRSEMRRVTLSMNGLIQQVVKTAERDAPDREIVWKIGALPDAHGDPELLRLVLINLLSNAVKYTKTRAPAVIEVGCLPGAQEDVFFVRDNGVGFDMRYVEKLFGVFQRLHSSAEFEGTGIGLANVRRIISRHGGRAWAEGAVDRGAAFYFSLPK